MADQKLPDDNPEFQENYRKTNVDLEGRQDMLPQGQTGKAAGAGRDLQESTPLEGEPQKRLGVSDTGPAYQKLPQDMPPGESPAADSAAATSDSKDPTAGSSDIRSDAWLIQKASEIYNASSDYLDANITNQWERNLAHFNSDHAPGTNFKKKNFKRSRVFRPKTRAMTKGQEAAVATAFFASQHLLIIEAENPEDEQQYISAQINKNLLQYRLSKRMPWFQTVLGAYQCCNVYGICISHQFWRYEADTDWAPAYDGSGKMIFEDDPEGNAQLMGTTKEVVRYDDLVCDLIAPENFRFDPMCDWRDPAQTSPYLIYMMPMYAGDALERMEIADSKTGAKRWHRHSLGSILGTRRQDYDRTRQAREGRDRIDPADEQHGNSYTTVWAHLNIIRTNGEDIAYWTMGTELLLTNPVPLHELYPHLKRNERPFVVGTATIEAFRNYPAGNVEQSAGLQEEINVIANSRVDNVKLVLNKRYYVKRGAQVDLEALIRNVPGGGVMMNDIENDVKTVDTPDITSSSYEEQDRLSLEMDDLTGAFAPGSVSAGKKLGDTQGGLSMIQQSAGAVQDYGIMTFIQTWVEKVLRQLLKAEQMYETDDVLLTIASKKSDLWQRFGLDKPTDDLLRKDLTCNVDVGMGNTDPVRRVERLVMGVQNVMPMPGMLERMKSPAIADEIFGALGYKNSNRFFMNDEEFKAQQEKNEAQGSVPPELEYKMLELQMHQQDNEMRNERENLKMQQNYQVSMAQIASSQGITIQQLEQQTQIDQSKIASTERIAAMKETSKVRELNLKSMTGSGI